MSRKVIASVLPALQAARLQEDPALRDVVQLQEAATEGAVAGRCPVGEGMY
jgi:hypothetical protein